MRKLIIPAVACLMMASPLALAQQAQDQSSSSPSQSDQTAAQSGSASSGSASSGSQASGSQTSGARSYGAVQSSLEKAGIQNVKVLDAAYLVRATTKDGEEVSFVVEPPVGGMGGSTSSGGSGTSGGAGSSGSSSSGASAMSGSQDTVRQALSDAGFQNIRFVDASYLAQAQTKDGDQITMMIDPSMGGGGSQSASGGSASGGSTSGSSTSGSSSGAGTD